MGWASGSEIATILWKGIQEYIPSENKKFVTRKIYKLFESYDADDWTYQDEEGDLFYDFLKENHPELLQKFLKEGLEDEDWDGIDD